MKSIYVFVLIFTLGMLYSCGPVTPPRKFYAYQSSSIGAIKSYTAKPAYNGKKEKALYLSTSLSKGSLKQNTASITTKDTKKSGVISLHKSVTDKYYNYHYGAGVTFGKYRFGNSLNDFITEGEKKDFYAINLKTGINFNQSTRVVDFRIIGLEFTYDYQDGAYEKKLVDIPVGDVDPGYYNIAVRNPKALFSYNINTEFVFKLNKKNNLGFGFFYGETIKSNHSFNFNGMTLFYNYNKITFSVVGESLGKNLNETVLTNTKFGLTYELIRN